MTAHALNMGIDQDLLKAKLSTGGAVKLKV
jgi:hypothetical protein